MTKNLSQEIKDFAHSLGFDPVSIMSADALPDAGLYYEKWLQKGYAADMDYLKKDTAKRYTPEKILPGARSIIMLGLNYYQKDREFSENFRIAKYAHGRDYHKVIAGKLKKFGVFLADASASIPHAPPGALSIPSSKSYVDFGPIMERAFASKSSLGFIGKNACIITREYGSFIFLSEVITTLELTPDEPTKWQGKCGSCTRCVDICPTKAIKPDRTIDSNLCISYLTIENRGAIPEELRPKIGNWLFGCDLCQDICPHNVRAKPTRVEDFKNISVGVQNLSLSQILSIETDNEFTRLFAGTPIMRAKRRGLIRNACVVAGNLMSSDSQLRATLTPLLKKLSQSDDEMIAEHAQWAIQQVSAVRPSQQSSRK